MTADTDTLHWYEKAALGLAMAAQALVVMQWYLDGNYPAAWLHTLLQWLVVIVAIAAGIALDAVVVTTVMGRREGRESLWGWATALAAAVFSALVALHMSGGWSAGPWLHIAYPVTTFLFAQHLSMPKKAKLSEVEQLTAWLEQERADAEQLRDENEQLIAWTEQDKASNERLSRERKQKDEYIAQLQQLAERENIKAEQYKAELEQALSAGELDRRALAQAMSSAGMTDRQIAPLLSVSTGTLSNWRRSNGKVLVPEGGTE